MSEIFIKLYMDENIPLITTRVLRSRGFDVLTTEEATNKGTDDAAQLEFAAQEGRAIVTINRIDFEVLAQEYFDKDIPHYGIFISPDIAAGKIADRLSRFLDMITEAEMIGQVVYI